jgi:hypothetical protein
MRGRGGQRPCHRWSADRPGEKRVRGREKTDRD